MREVQSVMCRRTAMKMAQSNIANAMWNADRSLWDIRRDGAGRVRCVSNGEEEWAW